MDVEVTPNFKTGKRVDDAKYIGFVKQLPCVICEAFGAPYGQPPSDFHHTIHGRHSQAKTSDCMGIPLCKGHHQTGENGKASVHGDLELFKELHGLDTDYIEVTQDRVLKEFGYTPKGLRND